MKNVIIYLRKSTEQDERQQQSLGDQKDWCLNYAKSADFNIIKIIEESKSAKQPGREGFNEMMKLIQDGKSQYIICWDLSRLSRNPIDQGVIVWLTQQNVIKEIHSTNGVINGDNILIMNVYFGMSTQFIVDLKKNVARGMQSKLAKGGYVGNVPLGYINDKNIKEVVIDEKKSEFVKMIFQMRKNKKSFREIGEKLFNLGLKSRTGKALTDSSIEQIIKNPFYVGLMKFSGETFLGKHPLFISKKLFDEVNAIKRSYKTKEGKEKK